MVRRVAVFRSFLVLVTLTSASILAFAQSPTTTTLTSTPGSSVLGQNVTFSATVAGAGGTPTGTVWFADNGQAIGTALLDVSGVARFSTAVLPPGNGQSITATYLGDGTFTPSSGSLTFTVERRPTTVDVTVLPATVAIRATSQVSVTVANNITGAPAGTPGGVASGHSMSTARAGHTATLLLDGTVLITGGSTTAGVTGTAEIYGTSTSTALTNELQPGRTGHSATLLPDGKVLIVGGSSSGNPADALNAIDVYDPDPAIGAFSSSGATLTTRRFGHTATLLSSGMVLIAGGYGTDGNALRSTELYDPMLHTVSPGPGPLGVYRAGHTATLLRGGDVLFAGGGIDSAELYDPTNGTTVATGNLTVVRTGHTATLLADGNVLLAGGASTTDPLATVELYSTAAGTFVAVGSMDTARSGHAATLLNSGLVLITGGGGAGGTLGSATLYTPSFDPQGTVPVTSNYHADVVTGSCVLALSGTGASSCQGPLTVKPIQVGSGIHQIAANFPASTNHTGSTGSTILTVVAGTVTVIVDNPHPAYNGSPQTAQARAQDAYGNSVSGDFTFTYNGSATPPVNAGSYAVVATFISADPDFPGATGTGTLTIVPAPLTPHVLVNDKIYDSTVAATVTTRTLTGVVANDDVTLTGGSATFADKNRGNAKPVTVTGLSLAGTATANYQLVSTGASSTASITARDVHITGVTARNKVYDGATAAMLNTGSAALADPIAGDALALDSTAASGAFADRNVGVAKPVAASGFTLTGADAGNYHLVSPAGLAADITPRAITVAADPQTRTYGNADPALTYAVTAGTLAGGDHFTGALTRVPGEAVLGGPYAIQLGTLTTGGNYDLAYVGANLTITPRPVTVQADAKDKTYGESDPAFTYRIGSGSLVFGDTPTGASARDPGENVGLYAITQGTLALNANYALTYQSANLVIGARPVAVGADQKAKVYGDADPPFTYQITSGSLINGDTFTGALARTAGENVGSYAITQGTLALSTNYSLTVNASHLAITIRPITVTAQPGTKSYGAPEPVLGYSITSGALQFSDIFTGALHRADGVNVGSYPIDQGTLALSANYTLAFVAANFVIAPATTHSSVATHFTVTGLKLTLTGTVYPQFTGVPAGKVTFADSVAGFTGPTATLVNGVAQADVSVAQFAAGTHNLTAQYDRTDPNFAAGTTSAPAVLLVVPAISVTSGQTIPDQTLQLTNPTDQTITLTNLSCQVEPIAGSVTAELRPVCALKGAPATLPPGSSSLTLTLGTKAGSSADVAPVTAGVRVRGLYATSFGFPAVAFLALAVPASRKRPWRKWVGLVIVLAVLVLAAACGGGGFKNPDNLQPSTGGGTQPGSYVVVVTYNDAQSNQVPLATVPLNVSY